MKRRSLKKISKKVDSLNNPTGGFMIYFINTLSCLLAAVALFLAVRRRKRLLLNKKSHHQQDVDAYVEKAMLLAIYSRCQDDFYRGYIYGFEGLSTRDRDLEECKKRLRQEVREFVETAFFKGLSVPDVYSI